MVNSGASCLGVMLSEFSWGMLVFGLAVLIPRVRDVPVKFFKNRFGPRRTGPRWFWAEMVLDRGDPEPYSCTSYSNTPTKCKQISPSKVNC